MGGVVAGNGDGRGTLSYVQAGREEGSFFFGYNEWPVHGIVSQTAKSGFRANACVSTL